MVKLPIFIALALVVTGSALAILQPWDDDVSGSGVDLTPTTLVAEFNVSAPLAKRIAALEGAIMTEREARQLLQNEVMVLTEELMRLDETLPAAAQNSAGDDNATDAVARRRNTVRNFFSTEARRTRLLEAGMDAALVDRVVLRESEVQMAGLRARYLAQHNVSSDADPDRGRSVYDVMREELGDNNYEKYLSANGQPTRISVAGVMQNSPAFDVGLRVGDRITSYAGQRVFNMGEFNRTVMRNAPGQTVVIDFVRDGQPMQVQVASGPLGIWGQ